MACWELEGRLKLSIALHEAIRNDLEHRGADIPCKGTPADLQHLKELHSLYSEWMNPAPEILFAIKSLESQGYDVAGAAPFRELVGQLRGFLAMTPESITQSMRDLEEGKFLSLEGVRNELRARSGERG